MAEHPGVAVVTGAASGIGAAVVSELQSRGLAVHGLDLTPAPACDRHSIVDVTDEEALAAAVAEAAATLGPATVAVSVAGHYEMLPVTEITGEQWHRMIRVHVGGLVHLARAVLPGMIAAGSGSIVAVTSELAIGGGRDDSHYAAAKGAVIGVVRSLAPEVAPHGVRVNAVAPGPTDTPLLAPDSPWRAADYLATLPAGRLALPGEIALVAGFLATEGTFCSGEIISPNSGAVI